MPSALDTPLWSALSGRQRAFGTVLDLAARFDPDRSPFGAFPVEPTPKHWAAMAEIVGPGGVVGPVGVLGDPPPGWTQLWKGDGIQMVGRYLHKPMGTRRPDLSGLSEMVALGPDDAEDMLALVTVAQPGPFERRTVEFGGYVGFRHAGRLVAMAGRRMKLEGAQEISAVATDPNFRRRGLAEQLVRRVAEEILDEGDLPILHASLGNVEAVRLYESMGFQRRRVITFGRVQAPH